MEGPVNGREYLATLQKTNGKQRQNYRDFFKYIDKKARKNGIPIGGQFELTPLCNLDCRMCYVHLTPEQLQGRSILTVPVWKDLMYQAVKAGMMQAHLTGGECLAYPGFEELYLYLQSLGCEVCVLTNGLLLDDGRIRFFRENMPADIQVTLYGWNDDVYERVTGKRAFGTVSRNITKAVEAGLPVTISVTPSVYLGEDVLETIRTASSLCGDVTVNTCIFTPREETGRSDQKDDPDLDLYIRISHLQAELKGEEIRKIPPDQLPPPGGPSHERGTCGLKCAAGRSAFIINWKGDMLACNRLSMIRGQPLETGFKEAWSRVNRKVNEWPMVPECEGCAYAKVCDHCAANMLLYAEPGKLPEKLCERTRYLVQNGARHIPDCE